MAETVRKKHVREPPSVPFIWEVKPGIPKKDWKPEISSVNHFPKPPLKQTASVPFVWEQKPGTPLPNFSHVSIDIVPSKPDTILFHVASSSSGYPVVSNYACDYKDTQSNNDASISILDLEEAFGFDTDESFSNSVVSSEKNSSAISMQKNSLINHNYDQIETPSSPASSETDSSTSSYETGRSSLVGATFLECLFPLYSPKSGFLERDENLEKVSTSSPPEPKARDFVHEDLTSDMVKRPPTLGELIMMSRRRSYRRKCVQMRKWDPPKEITRKQAFGCFSFVTSSNMIEGLLKRKYCPKLKLV